MNSRSPVLPAPSRRVTSLDVSREAGVSQSAVSRAFTPGAHIHPETRRRVLDAAERLGYQPNAIARSLVTQRSGIVALIVGELHNPFYPQALSQMAQALEVRGKRALLLTHDGRRDVQETLDAARSYQVEAAIVFPTRLSSTPPSLGDPLTDGVPVLLFNRQLPGHDLLSVSCDNEAGGRLAAQLLYSSGARRLAFIGGDPDTSTHQDRLRGFAGWLAETAAELVAAPARAFQYDWGMQATLDLHTAGIRPDGIFAANDIVALGVLDALRVLGRRVPDDVSVIGFDGIPEGARMAYRLTTVRQPLEAMIEDALEALFGPPGPATGRLHPGELVWRDTVGGARP